MSRYHGGAQMMSSRFFGLVLAACEAGCSFMIAICSISMMRRFNPPKVQIPPDRKSVV